MKLKEYNKLLAYIKQRIYFCSWIYGSFARPEEILSEAFLIMSEKGIEFDNNDIVFKIINKAIEKIWRIYVKSDPERYKRWIEKRRLYDKKQTERLTPYYISNLISINFRNNGIRMSPQDIRNNAGLMAEAKERLLKKRNASHRMRQTG